MKKRKIRVLVAGLAIAASAAIFAGCSSSQGSTGNGLNGSITAAGSTALQPLVEQAAKGFNNSNPGATINVQGGGSGTGLTQVQSGTVDIGNSDIYANEKSGVNASSLVDHKAAVVGFGVVANNKVGVDNLTKAQLIDIFTGKDTNWKQVGGADLPIHIINRPTSSGTRATFKKYGLDGKEEASGIALTEDSSGAVMKTIQTTDGAIGYLALSYLTPDVTSTVKVLKLDGVAINKQNITTGKYPIWSYEHMYTKGAPTGLTKAFIDYMGSSDVKAIADKLGYIPISDMKVSR